MLPSLLLHRVLATIALLKFQLQVTAASVAYIKHLRASVDGPRYTVCAQLATKNQGQVVTVESGEAYTILREKHWSQTAWKSPSCIYSPESVDKLADALGVLVSSNTTFAIRGGGHSPLPAWANIDNGVLIAMSKINDCSYNKESETIRVGFGNSWGDVYSYLEPFDRIVVGGRAPSVGLATLLGGGISHLSNKYGFASDNVVSFELLSSNGTSVVANVTSNPDVFFALKAGSNNFGIVTHATLRTYQFGRVWGGSLVYTNDYRDQLMQAFAAYQRSGQLDRDSALLSYMGINNNTIYVTLVYLNAVERPAAFEAFYGIPSIYDGTRIHDNFTDLINEQIDLVVPRWTFGATTVYLDENTYVDVARIAQNATTDLATINGGTMVLMPQPISTSMISESTAQSTSPMVLGLNATAQLWLCINMGWNFESDDAKIGQILMDTIHKIDDLTKLRGLYHQFVFLNDAYSSQSPIRSYGMNTFRRLKEVRRHIDPEGVFQRNVPGGFKLGL